MFGAGKKASLQNSPGDMEFKRLSLTGALLLIFLNDSNVRCRQWQSVSCLKHWISVIFVSCGWAI